MTILKLYNCEITPDRNCIVDSIETYLNGLTPVYTSENFQHVKIAQNVKIKINNTQDNIVKLANYARVQQSDALGVNFTDYYFFINKAVWKSQNTLELELDLDTLNTFQDEIVFDDKTNILRQHENRWRKSVYYNIIDWAPDSQLENNVEYRIARDSGDYIHCRTVDQTGTNSIVIKKYVNEVLTETTEAGADFYVQSNGTIELDMVNDDPVFMKTKSQLESDFDAGTYYCVVFSNSRYINTDSYLNWQNVLSSYRSDNGYFPIINWIAEDINPVLYKQNEYKLDDTANSLYNQSWYLVYKSYEAGEGIRCFLCPENETNYRYSVNNLTIQSNALITGTVYYLAWPKTSNKACSVRFTDVDGVFHNFNTTSYGSMKLNKDEMFKLKKLSGLIRVDMAYIHGDAVSYGHWYTTAVEVYDLENTDSVLQYEGTTDYDFSSWSGGTFDTEASVFRRRQDDITSWNYTTLANKTFKIDDAIKFSDLVRNDNKLVKIIKLPYIPTDKLIYDTDVLLTKCLVLNTAYFDYDNLEHMIFAKSAATPFNHTFNMIQNPMSPIMGRELGIDPQDERSADNEPKLLNSEFYKPKFVYDNFEYDFELESMNGVNYIRGLPFKVEFHPTSTVNSNILFKFVDYPIDNSGYATDSFANVLSCNRNNEEVIYSNNYIDYIKTGYNYDKKAKSIQQGQLASNVVAGAVSSAASAAIAGMIRGSAAGMYAAIAGGVIGLGTGIVSGVVQNMQSQNEIEKKKAELKAQKTTVAQCDDVDLYSVYTGNRAKLCIMECSEEMKDDIFNVFHYSGYKHVGQGVPSTNTRYWFNFIQCDAVFVEGESSIFYEYEDDIKSKLSSGITYYHEHDGIYNWEQDKENWEVSLI